MGIYRQTEVVTLFIGHAIYIYINESKTIGKYTKNRIFHCLNDASKNSTFL